MNVLREASTAVCRLYDSKWHHVQWKWTALWVLGILIVLINKPYCLYARNQGLYIFFFYTSVLKADNTCIRQAFLDNQILKFRSSLHPIESRALVKQKKKGGGKGWRCGTVTRANIPPQTHKQNRQRVAKKRLRGKREDTSSLLPEAEKRKRKREKGVVTGAEQREAFRERHAVGLHTHTHICIYRYNTLRFGAATVFKRKRKTEDRDSQIKRGEDYNARRG